MPLLQTLSTEFTKVRSVNQTSNGYVSKVPTGTEPSGDAGTATGASVLNFGSGDGVVCQNGLVVTFFGTGADDSTFSCRIIGWRSVGKNNSVTKLWVPVPLCEVAVTLSTAVGV